MKTEAEIICTNTFISTNEKERRQNLLDRWIAIITLMQKIDA